MPLPLTLHERPPGLRRRNLRRPLKTLPVGRVFFFDLGLPRARARTAQRGISALIGRSRLGLSRLNFAGGLAIRHALRNTQRPPRSTTYPHLVKDTSGPLTYASNAHWRRSSASQSGVASTPTDSRPPLEPTQFAVRAKTEATAHIDLDTARGADSCFTPAGRLSAARPGSRLRPPRASNLANPSGCSTAD